MILWLGVIMLWGTVLKDPKIKKVEHHYSSKSMVTAEKHNSHAYFAQVYFDATEPSENLLTSPNRREQARWLAD